MQYFNKTIGSNGTNRLDGIIESIGTIRFQGAIGSYGTSGCYLIARSDGTTGPGFDKTAGSRPMDTIGPMKQLGPSGPLHQVQWGHRVK